MENYDNYEKYLKVSEESSGTAEEKYQSYTEALEASQKKLQAAWENIAKDSGLAEFMTTMNNFLSGMVNNLPRIIKHASTLLLTLKGYKLVGAAMSFLGGGLPFFGGALQKGGNALYNGGPNYMGGATSAIGGAARKLKDKIKGRKGQGEGGRNVAETSQMTFEYSSQLAIVKQMTLELQEQLLLEKQKTLQEKEAKGIALSEEELKEKGLIQERLQTIEDQKQTLQEEKQTAEDQKQSGKGKLGGIIGTVIGIVINQAMSAFSTYLQSGTTHSTGDGNAWSGDQVESSAEAKQAYKNIATVWTALVPFAGQFIGEFMGDAIAKEIDRERDERNARVNAAENVISALNSTSDEKSILTKLGINKANWTEEDQENANQAAQGFLDELYKKENTETRNLLEKKLNSVLKDLGEGNATSVSLYEAVKQIRDGDSESAERYSRALTIASLQAEADSKLASFEDDFADMTKQIGNIYDVVNDNIITKQAQAAADSHTAQEATDMAVIGASGVLGTVAGVALANSWNPVGWVLGLIAGVGLAATGGAMAYKYSQAEAEKAKDYQETYDRLVKEYNNKTIEQQIQYFQDFKETLEEAGEQDYEALATINEALNTLNSIKGQMQKIYDEMNTISAQQALYTAKSGESYLADMAIGELKRLGVDEIIAITAKELEKSGVYSMDVFDSKGNVTETAKALIKRTLMSDSEIAAVLSGQSYTLSEALKLDRSSGYNLDILENFANAIHSSVEELGGLEQAFGDLTLKELLSSVEDLNNQLNSTLELIQKINDPTTSVNDWMSTLISSYPELIQYIGNIDALNQKLLDKEEQLDNVILKNQFDKIASSEEYFASVKDQILDLIGDTSGEAQKQLDKFSTLDQLIKWIATAPEDEKLLAEKMREALAKQMKDVDLRSNATQIANVKKYVEAVTSSLDKQIDNLNKQKEALQNITSKREYENKLVEARLNLENASKDKKKVYRAGVGWVYEADQEALRKAQDELDKLDTEKTIAELALQIAQLEQEKSDLESIEKNKTYNALQQWRESFESHEGISGSVADILILLSDIYDGVSKGFNELTDDSVEATRANRTAALKKLQEAETTALNAYKNIGTNPKTYNEAQSNLATLYSKYKNAGLVSINDLSDEGWKMATGAAGYGQQLISSTYKLKNPAGGGYFELTSKEVPAINEANNIFEHIKNGSSDVYLFTSSNKNGVKLSSLGITPTMDDTASSYFANSAFNGALIYDAESGDWIKIFANKALGLAVRQQEGSLDAPVWNKSAAQGSLGLSGGSTLINELGTEAIITPSGTITALPSSTGIVPADITKNLWSLGEVAPLIQRALLGGFSDYKTNSLLGGTDESFNVGTINMEVHADESFDVDKFIDTVKARVSLTRNNK